MSGEEARAVVEAISSDPAALDALAAALWPRLRRVESRAQADRVSMESAATEDWRRKHGLRDPAHAERWDRPNG